MTSLAQMIEKIKQHRLLFLLIGIAIGLFFLYYKIQPDLTYSFSHLFDGTQYLKAYRYFDHETAAYDVRFPMNTRILVPYMASRMPFPDPVHDFLAINLLFTILSVVALYFLWMALKIPSGHIMTGFFWLFIHWVGIIRHNIFDPVTVDVPVYFLQALLLILILNRKYLWLLLLGPVAILQKESFPALLIAILLASIYEAYMGKKPYRYAWLVGASIILSIAIKAVATHYFPPADPGKNSIIVVLFHIRETLLNPFRVVRWLVSVFTAYGPLLMLAIWTAIRSRTLLKGDPSLILLGITYFFLSIFAGGDFTRIAFLGFPFIMTWILIQLKDVKGFMFKAAFIAGIPLLKLFGSLPDPAVTGWDKFNNWFPEYANPVIVLLWLIYGILCLAMFRIIEKKLSLLS